MGRIQVKEPIAGTFACYRCGRSSRFTMPVHDPSGLRMRRTTGMETRLYRCEFCGTENEIAQSTSTWQLIDDPEIPIASEKVVDARPPLEDVERRERMEASL